MEINKEHKMWVVIDTAGNADVHTIRPTRKASEGAAVRNRVVNTTWDEFKQEGYRCVKIHITINTTLQWNTQR